MELFPKKFFPELNTKNLSNSTIFLTITYTTLSAKRFGKYRILTIDVAVVFCFWTEQWWNRSSIFRLGLTKTPEVPNTILEGNSLCFPMVY
jgi:hypothetical protein